MKLWNKVGRGQGITSLRSTSLIHSATLPPLHHHIIPFSLPPPRHLLLRRPPRAAKQLPQLSLSSCSASPFLLHKLPKQQSGSVVDVAWHGAQLAGPASRSSCRERPARRTLAPSSNQMTALRFSGFNGILSVAIEAIGKQRLKMNYPVPSPSLTNK